MNMLVYLSISTGILLIAFVILLFISASKLNHKKEQAKVKSSYNTSVLKKHISAEAID